MAKLSWGFSEESGNGDGASPLSPTPITPRVESVVVEDASSQEHISDVTLDGDFQEYDQHETQDLRRNIFADVARFLAVLFVTLAVWLSTSALLAYWTTVSYSQSSLLDLSIFFAANAFGSGVTVANTSDSWVYWFTFGPSLGGVLSWLVLGFGTFFIVRKFQLTWQILGLCSIVLPVLILIMLFVSEQRPVFVIYDSQEYFVKTALTSALAGIICTPVVVLLSALLAKNVIPAPLVETLKRFVNSLLVMFAVATIPILVGVAFTLSPVIAVVLAPVFFSLASAFVLGNPVMVALAIGDSHVHAAWSFSGVEGTIPNPAVIAVGITFLVVFIVMFGTNLRKAFRARFLRTDLLYMSGLLFLIFVIVTAGGRISVATLTPKMTGPDIVGAVAEALSNGMSAPMLSAWFLSLEPRWTVGIWVLLGIILASSAIVIYTTNKPAGGTRMSLTELEESLILVYQSGILDTDSFEAAKARLNVLKKRNRKRTRNQL